MLSSHMAWLAVTTPMIEQNRRRQQKGRGSTQGKLKPLDRPLDHGKNCSNPFKVCRRVRGNFKNKYWNSHQRTNRPNWIWQGGTTIVLLLVTIVREAWSTKKHWPQETPPRRRLLSNIFYWLNTWQTKRLPSSQPIVGQVTQMIISKPLLWGWKTWSNIMTFGVGCSILVGDATRWYHVLPVRSIHTYEDLERIFREEFSH